MVCIVAVSRCVCGGGGGGGHMEIRPVCTVYPSHTHTTLTIHCLHVCNPFYMFIYAYYHVYMLWWGAVLEFDPMHPHTYAPRLYDVVHQTLIPARIICT